MQTPHHTTPHHTTPHHTTPHHTTPHHTTHRYFYHLLYGLLIIVCFFAYCKDGNVPVVPVDPGVEDIHICDVEPPEEDVFLRLDCIKSRKDNPEKIKYCGDTKVITNTIKTANLPIYTVCRKESKGKDLTVTLKWKEAPSEGSGFGSGVVARNGEVVDSDSYEIYPQVTPYSDGMTKLELYEEKEHNYRIPYEGNQQGMCLYEPGTSTLYSFKFIDSDGDPITTDETTEMGTTSIEVMIPAGSQSTTFRLDPHRCPDSTSETKFQAPETNKANSTIISVGIIATSEGDIFAKDAGSKKLKVEFLNGELDKTEVIDGKTFDQAFTKAMLPFGGREMSEIKSPLRSDEAFAAADKVAGDYGTED